MMKMKRNVRLSTMVAMAAVILSSAAALAYAPVNDPVGYWPFDGDYSDWSGNALSGTGYGTSFGPGVAWGYPKCDQIGQAVHFDGGSSYVSVPHASVLSITSAISIVFHAKFDRCNPAEVLLAKRMQGGDMNYVVEWGAASDGNCLIEFTYGSLAGDLYPVYMAPANLADGQWHCLGFSFVFGQPSSAHWIVDGAELPGVWKYGDGTTDQYCGTQMPVTNTDPLTIGYQLSSSASYFLGDIDDLSIYQRALSAGDINTACTWQCPVATEHQSWGQLKSLYR